MVSLASLKRTAAKRWSRLAAPIAPGAVRAALRSLTSGTDTLVVHSSLSSCGHFTAGPEDLLEAFRGVSNTLVLPTFTYLYPESAALPGPVFDPRTSASHTGVLTEIFRAQPGVVRSLHATHSIAVSGDRAAEICEGHERQDSPAGAGTPFERLLTRGASALMFGVTAHSYTFFHTAEDAAGSLFAFEAGTRDRLRVLGPDGAIIESVSKRQSRNARRFAEAGVLLEHRGLARRVPLGRNSLLFVPDCAAAHEFLVARLKRVPDFLFQSCSSPLE